MKDTLIPPQVQDLIQREIHSVEQLEILLLLFHDKERVWTSAQVSNELRTSPASASRRLQDLARRRLILNEREDSDSFRFDAQRLPVDAAVIEQLDHCYRRYRIRIIELIFSRKASALDAFLDAFQIGKEDK